MDSVPVKIGLACGVAALLIAFVLVPKLQSANPQSADILAQVMGGTADYAADEAYQEADVYFHAGTHAKCVHEGGTAECNHHDGVAEPMQANLPLASWIQQMQTSTAPQLHRHLEGRESKEMLPWFVVATRLNPSLVEAWSTGTYWFYRSGDPKRAEQFVCSGIRSNPQDYRLYFDRGALYYHAHRWDDAVRDLQTAERLWKNLNEDSPFDLKAIRRYEGYARSHRTIGQ